MPAQRFLQDRHSDILAVHGRRKEHRWPADRHLDRLPEEFSPLPRAEAVLHPPTLRQPDDRAAQQSGGHLRIAAVP